MSPDETEALSQSYFSAFKAYKDNEIKQAADDYVLSGEFFPPRPAQIISLVKNSDQTRHTRELIERYTCSSCHKKVSAISEGQCLDCAAFPPPPNYKRTSLSKPQEKNYRMEGRIKCQKCGVVDTCIKEPSESGIWRCRKCYNDNEDRDLITKLNWMNDEAHTI